MTYTELQKQNAEQYQELFNFFAEEHGLVLTEGELCTIRLICNHYGNGL